MRRKYFFFNLLFISCIFMFIAVSAFSAEDITLITYYPSPYGMYNQLGAKSLGVGDNNADSKFDGSDIPTASGEVWIADKVGIGTDKPQAQLDVVGGVKVGKFNEVCDATKAGTIRWVDFDKEMQYCDGTGWKTIVFRAPTTCSAGEEIHGEVHNCYTGYGTVVIEGCKWCQCDISAGPDKGVWSCTYYCPPSVCPIVAPW